MTLRSGPREEMLRVNEQQKQHYEAQFRASEGEGWGEADPGRITTAWSAFRDLGLGEARRLAGVDEALFELHRRWLDDVSGKRVLDLGCFKGNALSLELAERAGEYVGLDLSERAAAHLNERLAHLPDARALAGDFLASGFADGAFDVVYAYSVLHHFRHLEVALDELARVLAPGGVVVTTDPLQTDPLNRFLRFCYRPFQSDRAWEWPFSRATFALIRRRFEIASVQGSQGAVKLAYPFLMAGRHALGLRLAAWGLRFDSTRADRFGFPLYLCWHVSLRLRSMRP